MRNPGSFRALLPRSHVPLCTQSQLVEPLLRVSSPLPQSSVYCRAMTGSLSSCCQISEREKETASGRARERGVMIETVVGWTLSLLLYNFFFPQSAVFSQPRGERVKYCLLLNHQLSELEVSQLAFKFFTLPFFCHLSLPLKAFFFRLGVNCCHCVDFPIEGATAIRSQML